MPPKKSDRSNFTGSPLSFDATAMRKSAIRTDEGDIRHAFIEDGILECMIALPSQVLYQN